MIILLTTKDLLNKISVPRIGIITGIEFDLRHMKNWMSDDNGSSSLIRVTLLGVQIFLLVNM